VFIGGEFTTVSNNNRKGLACLDFSDYSLTGFAAQVNGTVRALCRSGNALFFGGLFTSVNNVPRINLGSVNAVSGTLSAFNCPVNGTVNTLFADASKVYAGGYFSDVNGYTRNRLACIDTLNSQPYLPWNPGANDGVYSMIRSGNKIYLGGWFTQIGNQNRPNFAVIDMAGNLLPFNPAPDRFVRSMFLKGDSLFLAGDFDNLGPIPAYNSALIQTSTQSVLPWPTPLDSFSNVVYYGNGDYFAGGLFSYAGGLYQPFLARFTLNPLGGGDVDNTMVSRVFYPNPSTGDFSFRNPPREQGKIALLKIFTSTGVLVYEESLTLLDENRISAGNLPAGIYFIRLEGAVGTGNAKLVITR
jgi:hypothetical protein